MKMGKDGGNPHVCPPRQRQRQRQRYSSSSGWPSPHGTLNPLKNALVTLPKVICTTCPVRSALAGYMPFVPVEHTASMYPI